MKYGEEHVIQKEKEIESGKQQLHNKRHIDAVCINLIVLIGLVVICGCCVLGAVKGIFDNAPQVSEKELLSQGKTSVLYDSRGQKIQEINGTTAEQTYVGLNQISDALKNAFIAGEDARFYQHHGVDLKESVQSLFADVSGGTKEQGESGTITQILLQNQIIGSDDSRSVFSKIRRKIEEQYLAVHLEQTYGKDKILEYYLNTVCLGDNILGVQEAAYQYFDKEASSLNVSEATVLAAAGQDFEQYDPVKQEAANAVVREKILKKMLDQGFISEDEYEDALGDDIYKKIKTVVQGKTKDVLETDSYFAEAAIKQVIHDLKERLGYTQTQAYNTVYHNGIKIYTCQDTQIQKVCDQVIDDDSNYPDDSRFYLSYALTVREENGNVAEYTEQSLKTYLESGKQKVSLYFTDQEKAKKQIRRFKKMVLQNGGTILSEELDFIRQPQVSFVMMDHTTGQVKALAGGRKEEYIRSDGNRAVDYVRQPGEGLSVLSSYLPALDTAGLTLATARDDSVFRYEEGGLKKKMTKRTDYQGLTTIRDSILQGLTIPAARLLQEMDAQTGYDYLKNLGITTLVERQENEDGSVESDVSLDLAKGKLLQGVTNLDLTAAFACVANQGAYIQPVFYTKVVDREGNILLENEPEQKQVLHNSSAWLLTDTLVQNMQKQDVQAENYFGGVEVAGISSKTENNSDYWFEGYTPYYTAGIWCGYDKEKGQKDASFCQDIWEKIMHKVQEEKKLEDAVFDKPDDIQTAQICTKCGKLAVEGLCDEAQEGNCIRTEYFARETVPEQNCDCHVKYHICKVSGKPATDKCPKDQVESIVYLVKEEEGETKDTPYIITKKIQKKHCDKH